MKGNRAFFRKQVQLSGEWGSMGYILYLGRVLGSFCIWNKGLLRLYRQGRYNLKKPEKWGSKKIDPPGCKKPVFLPPGGEILGPEFAKFGRGVCNLAC